MLKLLAGLLLVLFGAVAWGEYRWARRTQELVDRLNADRLPATFVRVDFAAI